MAKGGARARSGPPPDPNALKRERDNGAWVDLPAEGRQGDAPVWPLGGDETRREIELWTELWQMPQAVMWERAGQHLEVAMYCRSFMEAEKHGAPSNARVVVLRMMEYLGINQPGLARNKWRIVTDETAKARADKAPVKSARDRMRVVGGDA